MNMRLIYIQEDDLDQGLVNTLRNIDFSEVKVLFFVELKEVDEKSAPMIDGLSRLRLRKAEKRIKNWLEDHLNTSIDLEVLAFDGRPNRNNPSYQLAVSPDDGLHVIIDPKYEQRIAPYLKHYAGAHQIKYLSLGDFTDQDLNSL